MTDTDYRAAYEDCLAELAQARDHIETLADHVEHLLGVLTNEYIGPQVLKKLRQRENGTAYDYEYIDFLVRGLESFGAKGWPQLWRRLTRMVVITDEGEIPMGDAILLPPNPEALRKGLKRYRERRADRKI